MATGATTSDYLYTQQMNYLLKGTAFSRPTTLYIALLTVTPPTALDGTGITEVVTLNGGVGTNYARIPMQAADWTGPGAGINLEYSNVADKSFATPGANWGTITGAALYNHATDSAPENLFYIARLGTSKTVNSGDGAPIIKAGQLRITRAVC
jgi:hypothetical protein